MRGDDGRITLLVLGYFLVVAVLLGVVTGVAGVQTERQRLFAVADAAALDAADALAADAYFTGGLPAGPVRVPLTDASVRAGAEQHLAEVGAGARFDRFALVSAGTADGVTAEVVLSAVATPPMVPAAVNTWTGGVPITVTARARASAG